MPRSSFRLMLAATVVLAATCGRNPRQGGSEGARPGQKGSPAPPDRASQVLRARLSAPRPPAPAAGDAKAAETWTAVRRLYETTGGHPLWLVDGRPRPEIAVLRDSVRRAAEDGLNPSDYDLRAADTLQSASGRGLFKKGGDLAPLMDADVRLSYAFLKFASHLERGRVPPGQVDEHWFGTQRDEDLVAALKVALESGTLRESLEKLESTRSTRLSRRCGRGIARSRPRAVGAACPRDGRPEGDGRIQASPLCART